MGLYILLAELGSAYKILRENSSEEDECTELEFGTEFAVGTEEDDSIGVDDRAAGVVGIDFLLIQQSPLFR